jgi:hypothetical protein
MWEFEICGFTLREENRVATGELRKLFENSSELNNKKVK